MNEQSPILSVMVISHNQVHLIGRCLESILRQRIRVPWEIVISDDASTDGTWEWIQELAKLRTEEIGLRINEIRGEILDGELVPEITCSQINSSEYDPTVTSDRCAANKANVYSHARGKYCVNIDADDYLLGDDIYQYQIDQLEAHPECTMALQNIWYQNDGEPVEKGHPWHCKGVLKENEIITLQDYCQRRMFTSNPAFMMRRDPDLNPMEKYGLLFDDGIISMHHIARGKIICTTRAQYVYVQYPNSIWNSACNHYEDASLKILSLTAVYLHYFQNNTTDVLNLRASDMVRALKSLKNICKPVFSSELISYVDRMNVNVITRIAHREYHLFYVGVLLLVFLIRGRIKLSFLILDRFIASLFKMSKLVHMSIDDFSEGLSQLIDKHPVSIYDIDIFRFFRIMHQLFNAKFTLYVFDQWNGHSLSMLKEQYINEFSSASDWLKIGFHGVDSERPSMVEPTKFEMALDDFMQSVRTFAGENSIARIVRQHYWFYPKEYLLKLKKNGVKICLTQKEQHLDSPIMQSWNTDVRVETDKGFLTNAINVENQRNQPLVVFTHEWALNFRNRIRLLSIVIFLFFKRFKFVCE